ncbi:MAG: DUF4910 domain-containing protein [Gammaproteobacteria bacterium]
MNPSKSAQIGQDIYALIETLYPICRSITGDGVRNTLSVLQQQFPLNIREVASGTQVFDWVVPKEWNVRDAYIKNKRGERLVDFRRHNLHVVSYSLPVHETLPLAELKPHIYSLPRQPEWIPYKTAYYNEAWGFCMAHNEFAKLTDEEYEVCIDSTLADGSLTYGEWLIQGGTDEEVLLFSHLCHPSLCNDNLSGIAVVIFLAKYLQRRTNRYSYRVIFAPGTIGSITWLSENRHHLDRIKHGLVIALVGDNGAFTYKKSRRGDTEIDRVANHALRAHSASASIVDFTPYGYDERQFCSPGINLPVGRLTRTPNGCYPEYHTSADNLDFVTPQSLAESLALCLQIIDVLERNRRFLNTNPMCEPQLGKRGLYRNTGGANLEEREFALLWALNLSDGENSVLDIAERSGIAFDVIHAAACDLERCGLLKCLY